MYIELKKFPTDNDWLWVKDCTLATVGKTATTDPDDDWKHRLLQARHSPIRELQFGFKIMDIPYWVAMHLVRHHVGCQPYVKTQRNDRQTHYDRGEAPQNQLVNLNWSMNAEALMTIANKRLCMQASPETRLVVTNMCKLVEEYFPEFRGLLVPMCEYHGGICHEMFPCGRCK